PQLLTMRFCRFRTALRFLLGTALLFLALAFALPQAARAECGDYVVIGSKAASTPAAMPEKPTAAHPGSHHPFQPGAPWSGPNCSRRSLPPVPVPVTTPQPTGERWGWVASWVVQIEQSSSLAVAPIASLALAHRGLDIYHPPR